MRSHSFRISAAAIIAGLLAGFFPVLAVSQSDGGPSNQRGSSSSNGNASPEKAPSLVDPAGPTISLVPSEQVFIMAATLNACGYNEGLEESAPIRKRVRDEINDALTKSEDAREKRDKVCLYIAQHRMTGSEKDISQYISLALYLSPPPELETTVELTQMPPDSTQVAEIAPLLRDFAAAVDLNGIWLTVHHIYDDEIRQLHDPLSQMIVNTNLYLKMPASTSPASRFIVVIEPLLSPALVNARIYGSDYIVVVSPVNGKIPMGDVRHTYLHYVIEPLLYARSNAIDRMQPILKEVRESPLDFRYRSDTVALTVECLIKAIEARTMDTGVPVYKIPAGIDRAEMPKYERERQVYQEKVDAVREATVRHDMTQGFVLTLYFYQQLMLFEKQPAGLSDSIGEMVYGMDIEQQVHRARNTVFDQQADGDVLQRSKPRALSGLDLAEARLEAGDVAAAASIARKSLDEKSDSLQSIADNSRADFILARVAIMSGHPEEAIDRFQKTIATSREPRELAWSHIYLGRMLDLECKRDEAVAEYKEALASRDGAQDTRVAAERGVKTAYAPVNGHSCADDSEGDSSDPAPPAGTGQQGQKPQR